jgi:uncharacterized tellurite resistance protein B-like protein
MFDHLLTWLTGADRPSDAVDPLQLAIVALLVQAALMDDHFDAAERAAIERLVVSRFGLTDTEIRRLVETAEQRAEESTQLLPFTRLVVERLSPQERIGIVEMLYEVVFADGQLDADEDALVRRIAGLVYVPDLERGAARKRVRARLGLPD